MHSRMTLSVFSLRSVVFTIVSLTIGSSARAETYHEAIVRSIEFERVGDPGEALRILEPYWLGYKNYYMLNMRLGWLHYLNNDYAKSEEYYNRAISISPNSTEAKLGLSLPLMAEKKWLPCEIAMTAVIKTDPLNYLANLRLSYVYRMRGKFSAADRICERMLNRYPSDVTWLVEMTRVKITLKQTSEAKSIAKMIKLLDPGNADIVRLFGQ